MIILAPFETLGEHRDRAESGQPYNDVFIKRCREKAIEYNKLEPVLRGGLLKELKKCVPFHRIYVVFDGISIPE